MPETLTLARFQELADAYGGIIARWPEQHRDAAMAMAPQSDARAILDQASALDMRLDAWQVARPSASLQQQVSASVPVPARKVVTRARLWWSGIGISAALAGAVAGTAAVIIAAPIEATPDTGTSFGDIADPET